mgnify:CR=1 FL=1
MKNAIIGCIGGYKPSDISVWCESINDFGFDGDKIMILYPDIHEETVSYLKNENFKIFQADPNTNLYDDRFLIINHILSNNSYEYVIHCDVKDSFFQKDPFTWLDNNLGKKHAVVGSESVKCKNMPWAVDNYKKTFPYEWEKIKDSVSFCCGVIGGRSEFLRDFFLILWRYNLTGVKFYNGWWRDQAALNILLNTIPINLSFKKLYHNDAFVCHLGANIANGDKNLMVDHEPKYDKNGVVSNESQQDFCIVHQYDRIPDLKLKIKQKYDTRAVKKI